jgi:hypothetical protein
VAEVDMGGEPGDGDLHSGGAFFGTRLTGF